MTLNLVGGVANRLAWQERKAETFTVSPLHSGNFWSGYRDSNRYGGEKTLGISLGTAVAFSGAAASPNCGYVSSPVLTFLLAIFNARLWLGSPGPAGGSTFKRSTPLFAATPLFVELLGRTNDYRKYVYLSNGGHFENLGLYEMVLRRCRYIVVIDASADPNYAFVDLAGAARKIRIDIGIPIVFEGPDTDFSSLRSERAPVNRAGSRALEAGEMLSREGHGVLGSPASPAESYVNLGKAQRRRTRVVFTTIT